MDRTYTLQQMKDAFNRTVEENLAGDLHDLAWDLYRKFEEDLRNG